jgi:signal transduction histidine kinase
MEILRQARSGGHEGGPLVSKLRTVAGKLYGGQLPFRVRLFNILATFGVLVSLLSSVAAFFLGNQPIEYVTYLLFAFLSFALIVYGTKTGRFERCYLITIVLIFMVGFPFFYFAGGAYYGALPYFFVFAILFTIFMLEGAKAIAVSLAELALYIGISVYAKLFVTVRPEYFDPDSLFFESVFGFSVVSISLGICMYLHFRLYNEQQHELEAARKQAEEYARMKSELFADMSHEMRTPLTVMSGYAQYAVEQIRVSGVNEQTLADLATIGDEAKRLAEMADGTLKILTSANTEARRNAAEVDISALTMRLSPLFGAICSRKGRRLTTRIDEGLPCVHGDTDALTQLLWNILQNAITHSDGDVTLSATTEADRIVIAVEDNGAGIPPALLPRIFERGVSGSKGGSGIGLAICRENTERHGGELTAESEPGRGTAVTVRLPAIMKGGVVHA